jgi:hypothetical protein
MGIVFFFGSVETKVQRVFIFGVIGPYPLRGYIQACAKKTKAPVLGLSPQAKIKKKS